MSPSSSDFVLKRVHSLTGVVPIGAFLLTHFYNMSYSLAGPEAFDRHLELLRARPYLAVFEWVFIYIPILYHGLLGLVMTRKMSMSAIRTRAMGGWRYILQRLSGIGVLLFVGAHVYKTRVEPWMGDYRVDFNHMRNGLSEPLTLAVYSLGVLGASYHLANGLWTFGITWGIWTGERSQRVATGACIALGIAILAVAVNSIFGFLGRGIGGVGVIPT